MCRQHCEKTVRHLSSLQDLVPLPLLAQGDVGDWLGQPLDNAAVLLNQVLQGVDLLKFDLLGRDPSSFELCNGLWIGHLLFDSDHSRSQLRGIVVTGGSAGLPYGFGT
jgi:hypothetical protein